MASAESEVDPPPARGSGHNPRRRTMEEVLAEIDKTHDNAQEKVQRRTPCRRMLGKVVASPVFEAMSYLTIIVNVILLIVETNFAANETDDVPTWVSYSNNLVMCLYAAEVSLRLYVLRRKFFTDCLRTLDLMVVVTDIGMFVILKLLSLHVAFPIEMLRLVRMLKVTRMLRIMAVFPELQMMLKGIFFAAKSIMWGCILLLLALCFFSIVAVMLIHPLNRDITRSGYWLEAGCDRCPRAFESVQASMLTLLQQLIAGDSWGEVTVPIIERYPWTGVFFIPVLITIALAVMNLLLAVIVDSAQESRSQSLREQAARHDKEFKEASGMLYNICKELDTDGSGYLSFDELSHGFHHHEDFGNILRVMDISEDDLKVVFEILDNDANGNVHYSEFVEQLNMMKHHEPHTLLVFIKFYVMQLRSHLNNMDKSLRREHAKPPLYSEGANSLPVVVAPAQAGLEDLDQLLEIRKQMVSTLRTQMDSFMDTQARLLDSLARDVQRHCDGNRPHTLGADASCRCKATQMKGPVGMQVEVSEVPGDAIGTRTGGVCPSTICWSQDRPEPREVPSEASAWPADTWPSGCALAGESPLVSI